MVPFPSLYFTESKDGCNVDYFVRRFLVLYKRKCQVSFTFIFLVCTAPCKRSCSYCSPFYLYEAVLISP